MKSIESLLSRNKELHDASIKTRFSSKKNSVYLIKVNNTKNVLKVYSEKNLESMNVEKHILLTSSEYQKPKLISYNNVERYILMSYVEGNNVCDLINNNSISLDEKSRIIKSLAYWFVQFHQTDNTPGKYVVHGDAILRNFLFKDSIVGLDFEESHIAHPSEDIANLCASILTTDPQFTPEKECLQDLFIQTYQKNINVELLHIDQQINYAVTNMQQRRKKKRE